MIKKKFIVFVVVGCLLFDVMIISLYKYGWRLFGYKYCEAPNLVHIANCEIIDEKIEIQGIVVSSAKKVDGIKYHVKDNTLYLGIHCKVFWTSTSLGSFNYSLDVKHQINQVVLVGEGHERLIYPTPTE